MPQPQKLTDRTYESAKLGLEMVREMVEKVFEMNKIKAVIIKKKRKELNRIEKKYSSDLNQIEKDIYKFENAIKQLSSAKEYYMFKQQYKEKLRLKKEAEKQKEMPVEEPLQ